MHKICWRITRRCNMTCSFCLAGDPTRYRGELATGDALRIIDQLVVSGLRKISFTGGEPLLRQDLPELITACSNGGLAASVTTNGILVNARWVDFFCRSQVLVKVSLHGPQMIHSALVGRDTYDHIVASIRSLAEAGARVGINCVVSRRNQPYVKGLLSEFAGLRLDHVLFQFLVPRENGQRWKSEALSANAVDDFTDQALQSAAQLECPFPLKFNDYAREPIRYAVLESDGSLVLASDVGAADLILGTCSQESLRLACNLLDCSLSADLLAGAEESDQGSSSATPMVR